VKFLDPPNEMVRTGLGGTVTEARAAPDLVDFDVEKGTRELTSQRARSVVTADRLVDAILAARLVDDYRNFISVPTGH
jgi:hypothetical protein